MVRVQEIIDIEHNEKFIWTFDSSKTTKGPVSVECFWNDEFRKFPLSDEEKKLKREAEKIRKRNERVELKKQKIIDKRNQKIENKLARKEAKEQLKLEKKKKKIKPKAIPAPFFKFN